MPSTRALIHAPWSASKVSTALRCPQLFHFKYIQKLKEPEVMPEARIGKAIHKALEQVLMGTPLAESTQAIRAELPSEIEQMRFDNLVPGIPPFLGRIGQFRRRRRVARQLVEYSLAVRRGRHGQHDRVDRVRVDHVRGVPEVRAGAVRRALPGIGEAVAHEVHVAREHHAVLRHADRRIVR
ncbi:MAG: PD-(D/E)XK nuclease family protein, partial [Polyangiales bacterium]